MSTRRRRSSRRANVTIDETSNLPEILQKLRKLAELEVYIGAQGDAELAMVAGIHEYGSIKAQIPARSFIGSGKKKATAAISKLVKSGIQLVIEGNKAPEDFLKEIGEKAHGKMLANFDRIRQPALSPEYAEQKGSNKILVQQRELRNSLTFIVARKRRR